MDPRQRRVALAGLVGLAVLALVVALSTLRGPASTTPTPGVSITPSASPTAAASASPSAATSAAPTTAPPAAGVGPDARHGFLTKGPSALRTETDSKSLVALPEFYNAAVSIDGKRIALLRGLETGGQLVTFDTGRPQQMTVVFDLAGTGEGAGELAWAADNSGSVLVAVHKFRIGEATEYTSLRAVDLATKTVTEIARFTDGRFLVPLYWDPATRSAAAYTTGPGGFGVDYVLIRDGQVSRTAFPFETIAYSIRADARTGRVLAIVGRDGSAVSTWRYDRFEQRTDLRPAAGEQVRVALWRPNIEEVVVGVGPPPLAPNAPTRIEVWSMANAHRSLADGGTSGLRLVRVDGTAALNGDFTLVDLETGRASGTVPRASNSELPYLPVLF